MTLISNKYENMTLTDTFYEMRKTTLYNSLCSTNSMLKEKRIRAEIEDLENAYQKQKEKQNVQRTDV